MELFYNNKRKKENWNEIPPQKEMNCRYKMIMNLTDCIMP
jgi:hypothetical protein